MRSQRTTRRSTTPPDTAMAPAEATSTVESPQPEADASRATGHALTDQLVAPLAPEVAGRGSATQRKFPFNAVAVCGGRASFNGLEPLAALVGQRLSDLMKDGPVFNVVSGGDANADSVQQLVGASFCAARGEAPKASQSRLTVIVPPGSDRETEALSPYGAAYVLSESEAARYQVEGTPASLGRYGERNAALVGNAAQLVVLGAGPMTLYEVVSAMSEGKPVAVCPETSTFDRLAYAIATHQVTSLEALEAHPAFREAGPVVQGLFEKNVRTLAAAAFDRWHRSGRAAEQPAWSVELSRAWSTVEQQAGAVRYPTDDAAGDPARDAAVARFLLGRVDANRAASSPPGDVWK
ncbi:MAG: hypothetical protein IPJ65_40260 [Archangiaceae bacterium]|nr:hypothetical protein [Archangiaceae bacterium]